MTNALTITAKEYRHADDGLAYFFSKSGIEYMIYFARGAVNVGRVNKLRGNFMSSDCYWDGVNNRGRRMPKLIADAVALIIS